MAEKIATRNAYGMALAELADKYPELVVFDADLARAMPYALRVAIFSAIS